MKICRIVPLRFKIGLNLAAFGCPPRKALHPADWLANPAFALKILSRDGLTVFPLCRGWPALC